MRVRFLYLLHENALMLSEYIYKEVIKKVTTKCLYNLWLIFSFWSVGFSL